MPEQHTPMRPLDVIMSYLEALEDEMRDAASNEERIDIVLEIVYQILHEHPEYTSCQ